MRVLVALAIGFAASAQSAVTYHEHIAAILDQHCAPCHRPGQSGPFSLLNYEDARKRATQIATVTRRRHMPPWLPAPGFGDFEGERRLSDAQIRSIEQWARAGAPEGNPARRPSPPVFVELGVRPADLVIEAAQPLKILPTVLISGTSSCGSPSVRRACRHEIRPGTHVHHANVATDARARAVTGNA
jgi:hypothetical protein